MDFLLELAWKNAVVAGALALAAAATGRLLRRPALAHGMWLLVLLKLVTPPLWQLPVPWLAPASPRPAVTQEVPAATVPPGPSAPTNYAAAVDTLATVASAGTFMLESTALPAPAEPLSGFSSIVSPVATDLPATWEQPLTDARPPFRLSWQETLICFWALGSAAWLTLLFVRLRRFRQLAQLARPGSAMDSRRVTELASSIGLKKSPKLHFLAARVPPMTWSFGGGHSLVIPKDLWDSLTPAQRDALILHELAHLRRGDHWIRHLELLVLVFHWWNPLSWWALHELQEAEEECCDAWVVRTLPHCAADYADLIVETVAYLSQRPTPALPPLASGLGQIQHVRKRLATIFRGPAAPRLSFSCWLLLAAIGSSLLPVIPTLAREPSSWVADSGNLSDLEDGLSVRRAGRELLLNETAPPWLTSGTSASRELQADELLSPFEENLAILRLQLIQRQAELTEEQVLLARATKTARRGVALVSKGNAGLELLEQILDDQRIHEARLRSREAAVQEMNLLIKQEEARVRRIKQSIPSTGSGIPSAKSSVDQRIDRMEQRLDDIFTQAKALEAELKAEAALEVDRTAKKSQTK